MIKILKYNCKDLNFVKCPNCSCLIQYKLKDLEVDDSKNNYIICPNCATTFGNICM